MGISETEVLARFAADHGLGEAFAGQARRLHVPLARELARLASAWPLTVGICGPQGSGKSTLTEVVAMVLNHVGLRTAVLSIDDLYLPRAQRLDLARRVHPLLATRGPPGTHEVALGIEVLDRLVRPGVTLLPRFDKAADDRRPLAEWEAFEGPADVVLLEGWCVGARAQYKADLAEPVNDLERLEDADGVWRAFVNGALAGDYQRLFSRLENLALLLAPDFATVLAWRGEQEAKLRARLDEPAQTLDPAGLARFVQHYQRLTEWIAKDQPRRSSWTARLDADRRGEWVPPLATPPPGA